MIVPAMFIFPSLMLFIYLVYETAKLSREKIRHQFAADSAAFIDMTNYTDFLNRSAYVNGAFPARIFYELLDPNDTGSQTCWNQNLGMVAPQNQFTTQCNGSKGGFDLTLWKQGAFPSIQSMPDFNSNDRDNTQGGQTLYNVPPWMGGSSWKIGFGGPRAWLNRTDRPNGAVGGGLDCANDPGDCSSVNPHKCVAGNCVELMSLCTLNGNCPGGVGGTGHWNVSDCDMEGGNIANSGSQQNFCPPGLGIFQSYESIYNLLGQVASSQYQVLQKIEEPGSSQVPDFLHKSYVYNVVGAAPAGGGSPCPSGSQVCMDEFNDADTNIGNAAGAYTSGGKALRGGVIFNCTNAVMMYELTQNTSACQTYSWQLQTFPTYCQICRGPNSNSCGYPVTNGLSAPAGAQSNDCGSNGLFQLITVSGSALQSAVAKVQSAHYASFGWELNVPWRPPANYFQIKPQQMASGGSLPVVHATVGLWCGPGVAPADCAQYPSSRIASVWPDPTPTFQARLYP